MCPLGPRTPTQVEILGDEKLGVSFVIRIATALKSKPKGPPQGSPAAAASGSGTSTQPQQQQQKQQAGGGGGGGGAGQWRNPFLPYEEELWVRHLSDTHTLLLNKVRASACAEREGRLAGWRGAHHLLLQTGGVAPPAPLSRPQPPNRALRARRAKGVVAGWAGGHHVAHVSTMELHTA